MSAGVADMTVGKVWVQPWQLKSFAAVVSG